MATVQDDTHRTYREATGLTSAHDLARLLAPAPRPYNVPRLPVPRTTDPTRADPEGEAEPWPEPSEAPKPRVLEPEVMPPPARPVRIMRAAPEPTGPSPWGIVLGILGTAALAVLAFGVGRDPTKPAPGVRLGGPSGFDSRTFR